MFGGLKLAGITLLGGLLVGGLGGWSWRDARCDAAEQKARADRLATQLAATNAANAALTNKTLTDAKAMAELENRIDGLQAKISDGDCFTDDDASRVRDLFRNGAGAPGSPR